MVGRNIIDSYTYLVKRNWLNWNSTGTIRQPCIELYFKALPRYTSWYQLCLYFYIILTMNQVFIVI